MLPIIWSICTSPIAFPVTSDSIILRFLSKTFLIFSPIFYKLVVISSIHSLELLLRTLRIHCSFSSVFLQMKVVAFLIFTFYFIYSRAGKFAQATSLATFLILWSYSSIRNTVSVITMYISFRFLLLLNFSKAESTLVSLTSWHAKTP